jgi:hypothetical protein
MTLGLFVLSASAQTNEKNKETTKTEVIKKDCAKKCCTKKEAKVENTVKSSPEKSKCSSDKKCSKGDSCCKKTGKTVANCDKKKEGCCKSGSGK